MTSLRESIQGSVAYRQLLPSGLAITSPERSFQFSWWGLGGAVTLQGCPDANVRALCAPILSRHLDFFEMVRNEDDLELARRFDMVRSLPGGGDCGGQGGPTAAATDPVLGGSSVGWVPWWVPP